VSSYQGIKEAHKPRDCAILHCTFFHTVSLLEVSCDTHICVTDIKQTQLHNKWHYTSQVHVTCNRSPTATHTHTISNIQTCILSLLVKQCSSLVVIFFMNVKLSLPVICYSGKIYVLVSNLMALCHKLIPVATWTHSECTNRASGELAAGSFRLHVIYQTETLFFTEYLFCMAQSYLWSRTWNSMMYVGVHAITGIGDVLM